MDICRNGKKTGRRKRRKTKLRKKHGVQACIHLAIARFVSEEDELEKLLTNTWQHAVTPSHEVRFGFFTLWVGCGVEDLARLPIADKRVKIHSSCMRAAFTPLRARM